MLGNTLGDPSSATTVSARDGAVELVDGPFTETSEFIGAIDVVDGVSSREAVALAATHPYAASDVIEVRPFYAG